MENYQYIFDSDHHRKGPYYHCREKSDISIYPLEIPHEDSTYLTKLQSNPHEKDQT
jgi:hypothetical protein